MAQQLRALTILTEDLGSIPSSPGLLQPFSTTLSTGVPISVSDLCRQWAHMWGICQHICRQNPYTCKKFLNPDLKIWGNKQE